MGVDEVNQGPAAERSALKKWLLEARNATGETQESLAVKLGVDRKTIYNAERIGGPLPQGLTMVRYLRALGVLSDAPVSLPGEDRLARLEEQVADLAGLVRDSLEREVIGSRPAPARSSRKRSDGAKR